MDNREYINSDGYLVRIYNEPTVVPMVIEYNGHSYLYSHFYKAEHYLVTWYNYYYKLEK